MRFHVRRAFTLIEVLVVVVIIGILASVVMAMVSSSGEQARRVGAETTAQRVQTAIRLYQLETGRLPDLVGGNWMPLTQQITAGDKVVGPFLFSTPKNLAAPGDPSLVVDTASDVDVATAAFGYDYQAGHGTGNFVAARKPSVP